MKLKATIDINVAEGTFHFVDGIPVPITYEYLERRVLSDLNTFTNKPTFQFGFGWSQQPCIFLVIRRDRGDQPSSIELSPKLPWSKEEIEKLGNDATRLLEILSKLGYEKPKAP